MHKSGAILPACALLLFGLIGCTGGQDTRPYSVRMAGNSEHGKQLVQSYGCGACHAIPGIYTARGVVGPSLVSFAQRTMIAGDLPNSPDNLVSWLRDAPAVDPKTAMPNLGLNDAQAHDIAAYLYTLR